MNDSMGFRAVCALAAGRSVGWALLLAISASGVGCGESENAAKRADEGVGPYGRTRFTFVPGPPGRAVGVVAVAELPSGAVRSPEIEIDLLDSGAWDPAALPADPPAPIEPPVQAARHSLVGLRESALCGAQISDVVSSFSTVNGRVCWVSMTIAGGALGAGGSVSKTALFAREGIYYMRSRSQDIYVPPDLVNVSNVVSTGCLLSPEGETMSLAYFEGLKPLSISTTSGFAVPLGSALHLSGGSGVGATVFLGNGLARGLQYDTTIASVSAPLLPIPVELRLGIDSTTVRGPRLVREQPGACAAAPELPFDAAAIAASDLMQASDPFDAAIGESLRPLAEQLAQREGFAPGLHVVAGSNADAWASLGGPGIEHGCAACPPSTLDDLVDNLHAEIAGQDDTAVIARAGARLARDLANVLPSPAQMDGLLHKSITGLELLDVKSVRSAAATSGDVYLGEGFVRSEVQAGDEVVLHVTATEIAQLIGRAESDVVGATLTVRAEPYLRASEHILEGPELRLSFTPKTAATLVVRTTVDLTTAAGPFEPALADAYIELAPRLITVKAGAAEHLHLLAPARVASGGPSTLNAVVTDAFGNATGDLARVRFENDTGESLGEATTRDGIAVLQHVLAPSVPLIDAVTRTTLVLKDDSQVPGVRIAGRGFSKDVEIVIDGVPLEPDSVERRVVDSTNILVAIELKAGASVQVRNPGGAASEAVVALTL